MNAKADALTAYDLAVARANAAHAAFHAACSKAPYSAATYAAYRLYEADDDAATDYAADLTHAA
ncbi:MAG TPA: hypothetical protein VM537_32500 [Anaerolineae bacterium]|nr:hypothetical protein [Anaerolineae bacterium]